MLIARQHEIGPTDDGLLTLDGQLIDEVAAPRLRGRDNDVALTLVDVRYRFGDEALRLVDEIARRLLARKRWLMTQYEMERDPLAFDLGVVVRRVAGEFVVGRIFRLQAAPPFSLDIDALQPLVVPRVAFVGEFDVVLLVKRGGVDQRPRRPPVRLSGLGSLAGVVLDIVVRRIDVKALPLEIGASIRVGDVYVELVGIPVPRCGEVTARRDGELAATVEHPVFELRYLFVLLWRGSPDIGEVSEMKVRRLVEFLMVETSDALC